MSSQSGDLGSQAVPNNVDVGQIHVAVVPQVRQQGRQLGGHQEPVTRRLLVRPLRSGAPVHNDDVEITLQPLQ